MSTFSRTINSARRAIFLNITTGFFDASGKVIVGITAAQLAGKIKGRYPGMFPAMYPVIGTPDDAVAELQRMSVLGVAGSTLVFLNYLQELPYFIQEVLPRMERAGLRAKAKRAA